VPFCVQRSFFVGDCSLTVSDALITVCKCESLVPCCMIIFVLFLCEPVNQSMIKQCNVKYLVLVF